MNYLSVPENRANPDSRLIEIAYLRLPARPGVSGPPLIYLAGGPGDAGIPGNPNGVQLWLPALDVGDVVLLDQRGTGRSRPNLVYGWRGPAPRHLYRSMEDGLRFIREVNDSAAAFFRNQGADLTGYTTVQSADDVNDLRIALGADQMNLLGFSYGTHLALATIRRHGDHVANAVLIGVEGPAHTYKLPIMMDVQWRKLCLMAAADAEIARYIPDLNALLDRVLDRLDREPMTVAIRDVRNGEPLDISVGADALRYILRRDIGDASDLPVFPRLLYSIDRGDPTLLGWFVQKRYQLGAHVMSTVMDLASGVSPQRRAMIEAQAARSPFGNISNFLMGDVAGDLEVPDLGPEFRAPIVSNVRTLFLSGTLDWNAPPFQAEEVRWGFPNSSHIIVRNAGHEQVLPHPKVGRAIFAFLRGDDVDDVTAAWPTRRFVPLEGYHPNVTHPSVPIPEVSTEGIDLPVYEGTYEFEGVAEVRFQARDGQLYASATDEEVRLRHLGDHTFAINTSRYIVFVPDAEPPRAEFHRDGSVVPADRERP
jgi:pimeloyl-ACP methyl ester carboxylesterase